MATLRKIYLDPTADGGKAQFTAFGAATDWQAVSKAQRVGATPSNTSGIQASADATLQDIIFSSIGALNPGEYVNYIKLWIYFEGAIPANHSLAATIQGGGEGFGDSKSHLSGVSGWRSHKVGPYNALSAFVSLATTLDVRLNLGESAAQAANTVITAVHLEIGVSEMEHLIVSGRNLVGAQSGKAWQGSFAQYPSLVFDNWLANETLGGVRSVFREMKSRSLDMVRVFVPFGDMMTSETVVNEQKFNDLEERLDIAIEEGVRVDVTGLCTFRPADADCVPAWLDALSEANRWATFQRWWRRMAQACAGNPAVAIYDIVNEPLTKDTGTGSWYGAPDFGFSFGVYLCKSLSGRTELQVAQQFMDSMKHITNGIRAWDKKKPCAYGILGVTDTDWATPSDVILIHQYPNQDLVISEGKDPITGTYMAMNKPMIVEETAAHFISSSDQIVDLWRWNQQQGIVACGPNWRNAFGSFNETNFGLWTRSMYVMQQRTVQQQRVAGTKGLVSRVGQRFS